MKLVICFRIDTKKRSINGYHLFRITYYDRLDHRKQTLRSFSLVIVLTTFCTSFSLKIFYFHPHYHYFHFYHALENSHKKNAMSICGS